MLTSMAIPLNDSGEFPERSLVEEEDEERDQDMETAEG